MDGIFNTYLSAHSAPAFPSAEEQALIETGELMPGAEEFDDQRIGGEKRADILRGVFESSARDAKTPTMGGGAPTVVVHVNAADLKSGTGVGWVDGVEAPISLRNVRQKMCAGGYQEVFLGEGGEVLRLGEKKRFFTPAQRRAIAARDGGCGSRQARPKDSRAAQWPPHGAKCTTSSRGNTKERPTQTTGSCSAGCITTPSTPPGGRFEWCRGAPGYAAQCFSTRHARGDPQAVTAQIRPAPLQGRTLA